MQSTFQFLQKVLPAANFYASVISDSSANPPKQKVFTSIELMATYLEQMGNMGWDTFFGCSGYEQTWHDNARGELNTKGGVKQVFRTQQNAYRQKAFWLDLDVKPDDPRSYATQEEAKDSLRAFVRDLGLPIPMIVGSGGGFHVYFCLTEDIDSNVWYGVAGMLDACVKHYGMKADSTRTMDSASILRPAPSVNHKEKYGPQGHPVTVLVEGVPTSVETLKGLLSQYMTRFSLNATAATSSAAGLMTSKLPPEVLEMVRKNPELRGMMTGFYEEAKDKDAARIIRMCPQIAEAGSGIEPVWMGMMTVMKCCPDGREQGRQISMRDPRHTDAQYNEKFDYVETMTGGPSKCSYFERHDPEGCASCPFRGRITSPAELGRIPPSERGGGYDDTEEENREPQVVSVQVQQANTTIPTQVMGSEATTVELYKINSDYYEMVEYDGLYVQREEKVQGETIARRVRVIDQSFFLISAQKYLNFFSPEVQYVFVVMERGKPNRNIRLSAKDLKSSSMFIEWCVNNQLVVSQHNEKDFISFMKAYLSQLQRKVPQVEMREQFGWTTTRNDAGAAHAFVLGEQLISPKSVPSDVGLRHGPKSYSDEALGCAGTLEGWLAVPEFYQRHNLLWGQLGICLAFGAILMKFAPGTAKNGLVNFWSNTGGTGKSTLQQVINSVWGHPEEQMMKVGDTVNARYRKMGWRNNLPICIDETTNVADAELSSLLFEVSEGREKSRMNQDSALQVSNTWSTITVISANNTILDKMMQSYGQRDAEVKRAIDVEVPLSPDVSRTDAVTMSRAYADNYGHAGKVFVQNLLNDPTLLNNMTAYIDAWVNKYSGGQDERFWENTMACAVIGGRLAKAMGLVQFDMDAVQTYALQQISGMRGGIFTSRTDSTSLLSDFLAENIGNTLVVCAETRTTPENPGQPPELDPYVIRMVRGSLDVRLEADTGTVYVRAGALAAWCKQRKVAVNPMLLELIYSGQMVLPGGAPARANPKDQVGTADQQFRVRLGRGISSIVDNPARCYKFSLNMSEEALSGLAGTQK